MTSLGTQRNGKKTLNFRHFQQGGIVGESPDIVENIVTLYVRARNINNNFDAFVQSPDLKCIISERSMQAARMARELVMLEKSPPPGASCWQVG